MEHERDRERDGSRDASSGDRREPERWPGKRARSAQLSAPTDPEPSGLVSRKANGGDGASDVDGAVRAAAQSPSTRLPEALQGRLEGALGVDLSPVRIHTGAESAHAAAKLGAHAYAHGQDVHFGAGEYRPGTPTGDALIAHEVAHTVQQRGAEPAVQGKLDVSSPSDAHELEAESFAQSFVAGTPHAPVARVGIGVARAAIYRTTTLPTTKVTGYSPVLQVTPKAQNAKLGTEIVEHAAVTNAAKANPGTTFQWKWASDRTDIQTGPQPGASARADLKLKPTQVGAFDVAAEVAMIESEGTITKRADPVRITVLEPVPKWTLEHRPGNVGAERARDLKSEPLKVFRNDTLVVRATLGNVDDAAVAGIKPGSSNIGSGAPPKATLAKNVVEWQAKLDNPGYQNLSFDLVVPGKADPLTHAVRAQVVMTLDDLKTTTNAAVAAVGSSWHAMSARLRKAKETFAKAKAEHTSTLNDAAALQRLTVELLLGAFFAGMGGAAGGAVGNTIKAKFTSEFANSAAGGAITDAGKDVAKFAVRSLDKLAKGDGSKAPAPASGGPANSAAGGSVDGVGQDPVAWADGIATKLDDEAAMLLAKLRDVLVQCSNASVTEEFTVEGDPVEAIKKSAFVKTMEQVSLKQQDYAVGLWETWIRTYSYSISHAHKEGHQRANAKDETADLLGKIHRGITKQCGEQEANRLLKDLLPQLKARAEKDAAEENKKR